MSIFDLVGKVIKKKFGQPKEDDLHTQYLKLKLEIEEMALQEGLNFKDLYMMGEVDSYRLLGREKNSRLVSARDQMSLIFPKLEPHERAHHSLTRGDEDLF